MLIDLADSAPATDLRTDVCVVGAGAAGITVARDLVDSGRDVVLLEAGGLDFEPATQALYDGENVGMDYYDIRESRLRFFGGTTNIWGGRCTPLNDIDFAHREWVAHSGWPIGPSDLKAYIRRSHDSLALGEFEYGESLWDRIGGAPPLAKSRVATHFWRFDTVAERFLATRCRDLLESPSCRVFTHANVVDMATGSDAVTKLRAVTLDGRAIEVRPAHVVLACGGMENARLLLATGIGNTHDQVGRYFMEHPHGRLGHVDGTDGFQLWRAFRKRRVADVPVAPALTLSEAEQRTRRTLNSAVTLKLEDQPRAFRWEKQAYMHLKHRLAPSKSGRAVWRAHRSARVALQRTIGERWKQLKTRAGTQRLAVMIRAEQAPNPSSRVTLGATKDPLGMPRLRLDWRLSAIDKHSLRALADVLDGEFTRLQLGRLTASPWLADENPDWPYDPTVGKHPIGGYHHMGTTRMSHSPRDGVVDANCRVHGTSNLYVAGSSVFTTSGWANPTLTILALSHRLAEHLHRGMHQTF